MTRPMRLFLLFLIICLSACSSAPAEEKKEGESKAAAETPATQENPMVKATENAAKSAEAEKPAQDAAAPGRKAAGEDKNPSALAAQPLSAEEAKLADRTVAFSNQARDILNGGVYAAVETLNKNARRYLETWKLDKRPRLPARHTSSTRLRPPAGIFDKAEEESLASALDSMDRAINNILDHYKSLEKYVADSSIVDDGEKGLELCEKLAQAHTQYISARKTWMEITEAKAALAEKKLMRDHPLQRQILAAQNIFAQMREVRDTLAAEPVNRQALGATAKAMEAVIEEGGHPPFQASPSLERLYKAFLKDARQYCQILNRGVLEGFHNVQKRELDAARQKCGSSYNEFARAVNKMSDRAGL